MNKYFAYNYVHYFSYFTYKNVIFAKFKIYIIYGQLLNTVVRPEISTSHLGIKANLMLEAQAVPNYGHWEILYVPWHRKAFCLKTCLDGIY